MDVLVDHRIVQYRAVHIHSGVIWDWEIRSLVASFGRIAVGRRIMGSYNTPSGIEGKTCILAHEHGAEIA